MRTAALVLFFFSFFAVPLVFAQISPTAFQSQLQLAIDPVYPTPNSDVIVTLDDYAVAGAGGAIVWKIDGVRRKDLDNKRTFTLTTGALGALTTIEATLVPINGPSQTARTSINPIYLDLIIEPQTRVPSFYQGRPLPSLGSVVNVTALINGTMIPPSDLIFRWQINDTVLLGGPVRGQNQISVTMPQGGGIVSVVVERLEGGVIGSKNVSLLNANQTVRFYEVNSLYGVGKRPLERLIMLGNSTIVRAEPYHLDSRTYNTPDIAEWSSSALALTRGGNPYEVTVVRGGGSDFGSIGFHVRNETQILQGAQAGIPVTF